MTPEQLDEIVKLIDSRLKGNIDEALGAVTTLKNELLEVSTPVYKNNDTPSQVSQRILQANWKQLMIHGNFFDDLSEVGFRVFSQNDEDGILLYIFTALGTHNKLAIEIGANCEESNVGFPQCNTANLIVNHGWNSLVIDGDQDNIGRLRHFFASALNTKHFHWFGRRSLKQGESYYYAPILEQAFVNRTNVNSIIMSHGINGEIDLLSIDLDGMDYWIWESISCINPRVVVIEFNNRIAANKAVTVDYSDDYAVDFSKGDIWAAGGVSLLALIKLGRQLGYTLVAVNNCRINAFFVRRDLVNSKFKELDIQKVFNNQLTLKLEDDDYDNPKGGISV